MRLKQATAESSLPAFREAAKLGDCAEGLASAHERIIKGRPFH